MISAASMADLVRKGYVRFYYPYYYRWRDGHWRPLSLAEAEAFDECRQEKTVGFVRTLKCHRGGRLAAF